MTTPLIELKDITEESPLDDLKALANSLGVQFHPSSGPASLVKKLKEYEATLPVGGPENAEVETAPTKLELKRKATKKIRCSITCMNPNKLEWPAEPFQVSNGVVGRIREVVPFETDWHVSQIILNMIKARRCQVFQNTKDNKGNSVRIGKLIREFAIEILPPLTEEELADLAQRQAMAAGTSV